MKYNLTNIDPIEALMAARTIADFANSEGVSSIPHRARACYNHLGAVLADSVLQAGLNYETVVRPRIDYILLNYPQAVTINMLTEIVNAGRSAEFLNWRHHEKISRFENVVLSMHALGVSDTEGLRERLFEDSFCNDLQGIHGVGPKTIDYMSCLVGIESIAVDRHIRAFAKRAGVESANYYYLKRVFCFAADLLSIPRRNFDAWIWRRESKQEAAQLKLAV